MNKKSSIVLGALGLAALASACSVEMAEPQEFSEESSEAVTCSNEEAVNVVLAGIGTSAALEMKRWLPERDFEMVDGALRVSSYGTGRCPKYDGVNKECRYTKRWLSLQDKNPADPTKYLAEGMIIEGQALQVAILRDRIGAQWQRQGICNSRPDNGSADNCPVEYHDLAFTTKAPGACGDDWYFHAYKMGTTENLNAIDAAQLKNKLIFVGYPENPYLQFGTKWGSGAPLVTGYPGDVKIDPGGNSQGGGTTGSGSAGVYLVNPNTASAQSCTSAVMEGAVSDSGIIAALGSQCQCMTSPTAQAVTTFKPALRAGFVLCKP